MEGTRLRAATADMAGTLLEYVSWSGLCSATRCSLLARPSR